MLKLVSLIVHCSQRQEEGSKISEIAAQMKRSVEKVSPSFLSTTNSGDVSLTNQVRAYHKSFYRPDNLALIVVGQVEADQLFEALNPLEEKIISKVSLLGSELL